MIVESKGTAPTKLTVAASIPQKGPLAEVLARIAKLDEATSRGDSGAVESFFTADFVLRGPNNLLISRADMLAAIGRINTPGAFRYTSYERVIEAACCRVDLVILMGSEVTVSEGTSASTGRQLSRRFTDVWRKEDGEWRQLARQSTSV